MKALLISENKSDWEIIRNILKVHYSQMELVCTINATDAINAATMDGPFGFFLLDCNLRQDDPNKLGEDLIDLMGPRPILFFGHASVIKDRISQSLFDSNEFNEMIYKPLDRNDLLAEIKEKVDKALSWAQEEEFEQSIEEVNPEEFIPMKIRGFYLYNIFPYDIFLSITKTNYIKIISANKNYSHSTLATYAKKNIKFLYIKKDDQLQYLDSEADKCLTLLEKFEPKNSDIYILQLRSITISHQYILALGVTPKVQSLMEALVKSIYETSKDKFSLSKVLKGYPKLYEGVSSKSLLCAYISQSLGRKYGWDSGTTLKKLIVSSILQDITLAEDSLTKINTLDQFKEGDFDEKEFEDFINHPMAAAKYAKQFNNFSDIDFIIEAQHELPGRLGFPNRPSNSKFTQITAVFNSAQYVAAEIDGGEFTNNEFAVLLRSMTKHYTSALFKEAHKHLKSILKIEPEK